MTIEETLKPFDENEIQKFDEFQIVDVLQQLKPEEGTDISIELKSELMAFNFCENYSSKNHSWGTYFGPMMVWTQEDGSILEAPSLNAVTHEIIEYWEKRSTEAKNPMLIARYSGLVYDFKKKITGKLPSHEVIRRYVTALINVAKNNLHKYTTNTIGKLERALKLSLSINAKDLIEECKDTIINFEKITAIDDKPGLWGYTYDLLIENNKIELKELEEQELINELEARLGRLTSSDTELVKIDPWAAEAAAIRLAKYYRKKSKIEETRRVILKVGEAYEKIINEASGMQASGWLDHLYKLYLQFALKEEAEGILLKLREVGSKAVNELKSISASVEITQEQIDTYINSLTYGTIDEALTRFVIRYIPNKEEVREQVLDLSRKAPISFLVTHQIQDDKGRVLATIGPLENDLEGHIVRIMSQNMSISAFMQRLFIERMVQQHSLDTVEIMKFISNSAVIAKDRLSIIESGLNAYFSHNYLVAIHLLVPQIEESVRSIVELLGGNVLKQSKGGGGYHLKTFEEVLRDKLIIDNIGSDFSDYFRVLFTDQRGWNVRNNVSHGIARPESFNAQTADKVFHALLCLGKIHESN